MLPCRSYDCANTGPPSSSLSRTTSGSTVKDDSGENGMPLAFLISAFCHPLSIVSRRPLGSPSSTSWSATARSKWKICRKKKKRNTTSCDLIFGHATGINDGAKYSLALSLKKILVSSLVRLVVLYSPKV